MEASFLPLCPQPRVREGQVPSATLHCLRWGLSLPATGGRGFQVKLRSSPGPAWRPRSRCPLGPGWGSAQSCPSCPSVQAHPLAFLLSW